MFIVHGLFSTDIITNSSSVVYTQANNVGRLYELIDAILKLIGSDKKAKDMFDIVIIPSSTDWIAEELSVEVVLEKSFRAHAEKIGRTLEEMLGCEVKDLEDIKWQEGDKILEKFVIELAKTGYEFELEEDHDSSYVVYLKDGQPTAIGSLVEGLFESHEYYS